MNSGPVPDDTVLWGILTLYEIPSSPGGENPVNWAKQADIKVAENKQEMCNDFMVVCEA